VANSAQPVPGPAPRRSMVIPCYNERNRLPATLASVQAYVDARSVPTEIVVVDDGSRDGTADWVREQAARDPRIRLVGYGGNRGKGYAVTVGMLEARGEALLFMDADGATPVEEADPFWLKLESGAADVVIGSRRAAGSQVEVAQKALRSLASDVFALLARVLLVYGVQDTQCGFKMFSRSAARQIFSRVGTASAIFDMEVLLLAGRNRLRVVELPVRWRHDDDSRLTYNLRRSIRIFMELLRIKARHRVLWPVRVHP
jgi:dolichyl-phosphate beta-glucosyltransferase